MEEIMEEYQTGGQHTVEANDDQVKDLEAGDR